DRLRDGGGERLAVLLGHGDHVGLGLGDVPGPAALLDLGRDLVGGAELLALVRDPGPAVVVTARGEAGTGDRDRAHLQEASSVHVSSSAAESPDPALRVVEQGLDAGL